MDRKDFLKLISLASVGAPFMLNGMPSRFMNQFLDFQTSCDVVNDRVLVIVRLAGANDGLNTVIPVNQYDTYAALRPNIKINNVGTGSYIPLDTTVSLGKQVGLHPSMTGFKSLYDSGKLLLMNGVGYPTPNYSHFRSENLLFSGKDGNNSQELNDGIFGRYLSALHPGLAGNPTVQSPDPLAIQLGNLNPCLFYEHSIEKNIEYNITGFQNSLFNNLTNRTTSVVPSEYDDLLTYIKGVAVSMDSYYNRIMSLFNSGSNTPGSNYPTTSLGKQLKTVARLLKGGSKTKIFQVNIYGFDTHGNQVQSGSNHLGTHAAILADLSNCVASFQTDLQNLGIADKVLTVTFSEFGRQVRENGSLGTDHGDLAPFFIVGNAAAAGILGDHPIFSNTTSYYYNQTQRKFDYRQIFASLLQDWLGADSTLMTAAELNAYSGQVSTVSDSQKASSVCSTLDTKEVKMAKDIRIFPIPAVNSFNIDFGNIKYKDLEVKLYDASGRQVLETYPNHYSSTVEIFTRNLKEGVYIVRVKTDNDIFSKKVIIGH